MQRVENFPIDINWTRMAQLKFTGNQSGQGWLSISIPFFGFNYKFCGIITEAKQHNSLLSGPRFIENKTMTMTMTMTQFIRGRWCGAESSDILDLSHQRQSDSHLQSSTPGLIAGIIYLRSVIRIITYTNFTLKICTTITKIGIPQSMFVFLLDNIDIV